MWGTAITLYMGLKAISWAGRTVTAPLWKHLAYWFAWPGMDADAFLSRSNPDSPTGGEWTLAVSKFCFGALLVWGIGPLFHRIPLAHGWIGMIGVAFLLHFGLFHLLSCLWRACGLTAVPLMDWPILARTVSEFWGRRWNRAFRDLTHRFLFTPLTGRLGPTVALGAGFLMSGIIHDLVISWPVGAGGGWPTAYFLVQALGILVERSRHGRRLGLGRGGIGRVFCIAVVVLPVPWLFHEAFILRVFVPFLTFVGA